MDDKLDCRFCKHHCQTYEYGNGDAKQIVTCMIDNRIVDPTEAPKKCKDKKTYSRIPRHKEYTVTIKIDHNISDFDSCMLNGGLRFGRANKQTLVEHVLNRCFSAGVHEFNIDVDYEILDIDGEPKEQIVRTVKKPLLYKGLIVHWLSLRGLMPKNCRVKRRRQSTLCCCLWHLIRMSLTRPTLRCCSRP